MTIDEKLKYNINREAAKISALSSGKSDQSRIKKKQNMLLIQNPNHK